MIILENVDKNNLHHAYLIEGEKENAVQEVLAFIESIGIPTNNNADFSHIQVDTFKIDDARNLKSYVGERGFSTNKKFFVISANSFLLEAQNSLLKIFEEPIENTHFFVIIPDTNGLLKTLVSRFYKITIKESGQNNLTTVDEFLDMSLKNRIDFIKELTTKSDDDMETHEVDSTRTKAIKFLNSLEYALNQKIHSESNFRKNSIEIFEHIFKVRKFLRESGSSPKTLLESVALMVPLKF